MPIKKLKSYLDTRYQRWVVISLIIFASLCILLRILLSSAGGIPANDQVYSLTYDARFKADAATNVINLSPPWDTKYAHVISQSLDIPNLRILRRNTNKQFSREISTVSTTPGNKHITAEFTIHVSPQGHSAILPKKIALTPSQRDSYLNSNADIDTESLEVLSVINDFSIFQESKSAVVEKIFQYANSRILIDNNILDDDVESVLRSGRATTLGRAKAMIALVRASKIPARLVTGFVLKETINVEEHYWVEVFTNDIWQAYDPENGYFQELPANFIPVRKGGSTIINSPSISEFDINFDITEQYLPTGILGKETKNVFDIFDISRLSLDARNTLAILLLLPLGALFTTFCNCILGIRSFGTFTPTLLALAAKYADALTTTVIFMIVAISGLLGQSFMPNKLSRIPRLSIVFTLVAMSMALSVSFMDYFSFNPEGYVVLLPIIILTSLIDRLYKSLDEDGVKVALLTLGWTAIVGIGCYFILIQEQLGHLILQYPEIHLFSIALILIIANYKYKKLSEIRFFTWIQLPSKIKKDKVKTTKDNTDTEVQ